MWICKLRGHNYDGSYSITPEGGKKIDWILICSRCGNVIDLTHVIEKFLAAPQTTKGETSQ